MRVDDLVRRGNELIGSGEYRAAAAHFDAAARADGCNVEAHFGRGLARYQLGDHAAAVAALSRCLELQPDHPGNAAAYVMRCMARANLGDRAGAMADYRKAVTRDPATADFLQSQTCVGTAQVVVLARSHPARMAEIVDKLTRV